MQWDEKWSSLSSDLERGEKLLREIFIPSKSSSSMLMLPARSLSSTPCLQKLAVMETEPGATTEHEMELELAGFGHPRKSQ